MNRLVAPALAIVLALITSGNASAATFYKTQSGKVRCFTSSYEPKIGEPAAVCETDAPETGYAFPQGPGCYRGGTWGACNIVLVNSRGQLFWDAGNIPGSGDIHPIVMLYGQTYNSDGWTVAAGSDGTRITNNATGHGMFVSIFNTYGF